MGQLPNLHNETRRHRTVAAVVGVLVAPGALFLGTTIVGAANDGPLDSGAATDVSTVSVQRRDLSIGHEAIGTVEAASTLDVGSPTDGRVLSTAEPGTPVTPGTVIARVDDRTIVALGGSLPMWRDLSVGDVGADVAQLETALVDLGFDPDANVTVDDEFTDATAAMVRDWQGALGVDDSGSVLRSDIVMISEPMRTSSIVAGVGAAVDPDDPLVVLESERQVVATEIAVADALTFGIADPVSLELPDRTDLSGTVQSVTRGADDAVRSVVIEFDDSAQVPPFGGVTVNVNWDSTIANDMLTLPADTFRRLESGVYAVDVLDDGSISAVEVQVGAVVGGFVEVFGLAEGATVVRP
jgi:peptidoglycan hydrolase-like protein with peptidoglycan-binding domain